ncbi:MAG: hypothetical protein ACRDZ1_10565 [Acidimicrobiia bacterium]
MLWFEREVVTTLLDTDDRERRSAIEEYVDGALGAMPEHLRAGVVVESLVLGAWVRLQRALGRLDRRTLDTRLEAWEASPIGPVRQYVRMMRSLVLFAEHELAP